MVRQSGACPDGDADGEALSRESQEFSRVLRTIVLEGLRETGSFHLHGFGIWTLRVRPARRIRNPATKQLMVIPASPEVRFRASKRLKLAALEVAR